MKKIIILLFALAAFSSAGTLTESAYKAYQAKHYKKALELYKKAYKEGDIKATYNLAVLNEKGLGTKKDIDEASTLYGMVLMALENVNKLNDPATCKNKMLPYYYKTLKKLAKYENNTSYLKKYKKLKKLCSKSYKNPYLGKCPAAKIIKKEDRYDMHIFDCRLYKKYPRTMKKLLSIHSKYRNTQVRFWPKNANLQQQLIEKEKALLNQMKSVSQPIIKDYLKEGEACIKKAEIKGDLMQCEGIYRGKISDLLMPGPKPVAESKWFFATPKERKQMKKESMKKATSKDKQEYLNRLKMITK